MDIKNNKINKQKDLLFIIVLISLIITIVSVNFIVDPYYIFRNSTIKGFNNIKTHKYSNKRTIIYSDIKINSKNKDIAFTGNCCLSHYGFGLDNVAFFTIPVTKIEEVSDIIKNLHKLSPNIKKIYWGLFFDDFCNTKNTEVSDLLPKLTNKSFVFQDFINLFFSFNTTKYSIETVRDSIKNKGKDIIYVYPYREIAKKTYNGSFPFESLNRIKEIKDFAKKNNIELIIYYSPIHITKKIHLYEKGMWEYNQELKRKLADITPFYDYSFANEYNVEPLDENNYNFIDNIHPSNTYNNLIVNDLLDQEKKIGNLITKNNVENFLKKDTKQLLDYINKNKTLAENIKNVKESDYNTRIRRKDII